MDTRIADLERRIGASTLEFDGELFSEYYMVMGRAGRLRDFQGYKLLPDQYAGILKVDEQIEGINWSKTHSSLSVVFGVIGRIHLDRYSNYSGKLIMPSELSYVHSLYIRGNELSHLDVTQLNLLSYLNCESNNLFSLELNGAKNLITVWCGGNHLKQLDLSCAFGLVELGFSDNDLEELNIGKNQNLTYLAGWQNNLKKLNTQHNKKLKYIDIRDNSLSAEEIEKIKSAGRKVKKFIFIHWCG